MTDSRLYLLKLVCDNKHVMIATAGNFATDAEAKTLGVQLRAALNQLQGAGIVRTSCKTCGATFLRLSLVRTEFANLADARPHISTMLEADATVN